MTVYTNPEIKKAINEAIPRGVDKGILSSVLTELLRENLDNDVKSYGNAIHAIMPARMSNADIIGSMLSALISHIVASCGPGFIVENYKWLQTEIYSSFFSTLVYAIHTSKPFRSMHQQELNRVAYGNEQAAIIDSSSISLIKDALNDKIEIIGGKVSIKGERNGRA